MTNKEKYKTPEERTKAFNDFCSLYESCVNCSMEGNSAIDCAYAWLELKYKEVEEDLKPCPFCGGTHIRIYDDYPKECSTFEVICRDCKTTVIITAQSKEEAIRKWNRRVNND